MLGCVPTQLTCFIGIYRCLWGALLLLSLQRPNPLRQWPWIPWPKSGVAAWITHLQGDSRALFASRGTPRLLFNKQTDALPFTALVTAPLLSTDNGLRFLVPHNLSCHKNVYGSTGSMPVCTLNESTTIKHWLSSALVYLLLVAGILTCNIPRLMEHEAEFRQGLNKMSVETEVELR